MAPVSQQQSLGQYIDGDVFHADGIVDRDGTCIFMSISRYISPCLEFEHGTPLGSIIQTPGPLREQCRLFAMRCLEALELRPSAFHVEFFNTGRALVFLEIGARVPSADVSYVIHDVYGVNLFQMWIDVLLGHRIEPLQYLSQESGGWVTIPRPRPLPQKVLNATPLLGKIPFLYRELVPQPGQILEDAGGYANLQGGRFLFRDGTERQIADAIRSVESQYTLTTTTQLSPPSCVRGMLSEATMTRLSNSDLLAKKCVVFAEACFGLFTSKIAASGLTPRSKSVPCWRSRCSGRITRCSGARRLCVSSTAELSRRQVCVPTFRSLASRPEATG